MAPYVCNVDIIPTDTEQAVVKASSPVLDSALSSSCLRKIAPFHLWHGIFSLNIGKRLIFQARDLIDMTELVFKKFSDVKLSETGCKEAPPPKKRKLCLFNVRQTPPKVHQLEEVRPSTPSPHLPADSLAVVKYEAYESGECSPFKCKVKIPATSKRRFRDIVRDSDSVAHGKRRSVGRLAPFAKWSQTMTPLERARSLGNFFKGCVNFVPASRLSTGLDIDESIKFFRECGKMMCIQDHWVEKGSRILWMGALVTYSRSTDTSYIYRMFFLGENPKILPLDVRRHLDLIAQMETQMTPFSDQRTSVFIYRVPSNGSREKLKKELRMYGEMESLHWMENTGWKSSTCIVTYRYAVEAYAVLLAFDGKRFNRSVLKTRLKMTEKLRRLHLMVAGSYN